MNKRTIIKQTRVKATTSNAHTSTKINGSTTDIKCRLLVNHAQLLRCVYSQQIERKKERKSQISDFSLLTL